MSRKRNYPTADPERRAWLLSCGVPDDLVDQVEASRVPDDLLASWDFDRSDFKPLTYLFNVVQVTQDEVEAYLHAGLEVYEIQPMAEARIPPQAAGWISQHWGDCSGWEHVREEARRVEIDDWYAICLLGAVDRPRATEPGKPWAMFTQDDADWLYGQGPYAADPIPDYDLFREAGMAPDEAARWLAAGVTSRDVETLKALRSPEARPWGEQESSD